MGVSGSGKTSLGQALARTAQLPFFDADDFHPTQNVVKMANGKYTRKLTQELLQECINSGVKK